MRDDEPRWAPAAVRLGGHPGVTARLEVTRFSRWRHLARVATRAVCWLGGSAATLVLTFDPFVASFPFVIGGGYTYRALRGRYRVHRFQGRCPRCGTELVLQPGTTIDLPHPLVCYHCHHEPELVLQPGLAA